MELKETILKHEKGEQEIRIRSLLETVEGEISCLRDCLKISRKRTAIRYAKQAKENLKTIQMILLHEKYKD